MEKAFLMIGIAPEDRDKLRFLWLRDPFNLESDLIQICFTKLMFGLRPSPAILGSVISHHLSKCKSANQANINTIQDSLYVDDLVCGANTIEKAFKIYRTGKRVLSEGGFNLRKWNSNSAEILQRIQIAESVLGDRSTKPQNNPATIVEEEESYTKSTTGNCDNTEFTKLLGIIWDSDQDEFLFSDACLQAYTAVLYMRSVYPDGGFSVKIIASKTRVAPVKTLTIPRLELLGAVLLAQLGNTVSKSLTHQYNLTYWIDSTAALYWITDDRPWKQYVSNHVKEICQLTNQDQWRHCPGQTFVWAVKQVWY